MTNAKPNPDVTKILWAAFVVSHFVFVGVAVFIRSQGEVEATPDVETLAIVLTTVGVVDALASALAVPMFATKLDFQTTVLLRFALAESTTIFGFVLSFLGADLLWTYALAAVGLAAHLAAFPSDHERDKHERQRARA